MKCTCSIGNRKCGKETEVDCPSIWIKHQQFDPRALIIFFTGIQGEKDLPLIRAFVCEDCSPRFEDFVRASYKRVKVMGSKIERIKEDYKI